MTILQRNSALYLFYSGFHKRCRRVRTAGAVVPEFPRVQTLPCSIVVQRIYASRGFASGFHGKLIQDSFLHVTFSPN